MSVLLDTPKWVRDIVSYKEQYLKPEILMGLAITLASANVRDGRSPFASVIADKEGFVIEVGWNSVVESFDSTAHSEVHAIRRAQHRIKSHDLSGRGFSLFSSACPCILCFGAIYWSGIQQVYSCALRSDVESLGFDEGLGGKELWSEARSRKGIIHHEGFLRSEATLAPLKEFGAKGGTRY